MPGIRLEVLADVANAVRGLDETTSRSKRMTDTIHKGAKLAALGLAAAGAGALALAKGAAEDEAAALKLATALKNSAGATDEQVAATEDWISAQGKALGVTDDELRPALAKLAAATEDVGEAQRLAALAMDISAGTGKSLESVSTALAKAQNGQVSALSKLGIKTKDSVKDNAAFERATIALAEAQKRYDEIVAESGANSDEARIAADKLALAQTNLGEAKGKVKNITIDFDEAQKRLAKTFKGQAQKQAETTAGKFKRLQVQLAEAGETIGYMLLPVLLTLANFLTGKVAPAVEDAIGWMEEHRTATIIIASVIGGFAVALIAASAALKVYAAWQTINAARAKAMAAAQWLQNAAMAANPITLVVLALVALAAGLVIAYKKSETFRRIVDKVFAAVRKVIGKVMDWFRTKVPEAFAKVLAFVQRWNFLAVVSRVYTKVRDLISGWISWFREAIPAAFSKVLDFIKKWNLFAVLDRVIDKVKAPLDRLVKWVGQLPGQIASKAAGMWDGLVTSLRSALNSIIDLWNSIDFGISITVPDWVPKVGGKGFRVDDVFPDIPKLAKGGVVHSPTLALIGEAGSEAVIPLDRLGGMGNVYKIHVAAPVGSSPVEIGRTIVQCIDEYETAGGRKRAA